LPLQPFGCLVRTGCSLAAVLILLLAIVAGALVWLASRPVGPHYANGVYTVVGADGRTRMDTISRAAAQRFAAKASPSLDAVTLVRLQRAGVDFTEEEVNSVLAEQLSAQPIDENGVHVERVFLELHAPQATAYVYGTSVGVPVTFSAGVTFSVSNEVAHVALHDPRAGELPIGLVLPYLLDWTGSTARLQSLLALAVPSHVTAIEPREGVLHVGV